MRKRISGEVNTDAIKSLALTLMNGHCESWDLQEHFSEWNALKTTNYLYNSPMQIVCGAV